MASSLDVVSGGRLEIGLGAGWYQLEIDAYGLDLGTVNERMARFEEGTEVVHLLLTELELRRPFLPPQQCTERAQTPSATSPTDCDWRQGERRTLRPWPPRFASMWDALFVEEEGRVASAS